MAAACALCTLRMIVEMACVCITVFECDLWVVSALCNCRRTWLFVLRGYLTRSAHECTWTMDASSVILFYRRCRVFR